MSEDTRLKGICYEMYLCVLYGECKTIADLQAKYEDLIVNYDEDSPPSHEGETEKYFYPSVKLRLKSMCYELFLAIRSDNQDIIQDLKDEFDYLVRKYYSRVPSGGGSGGITNHEELENLMGGNSSGHYHLTEAELETVRHGGGGSSVEVVNNYTTTTTGKALDAIKGKDLNDRVTTLEKTSGGGINFPESDNKVYVVKNGEWVQATIVEQPSEWSPDIDINQDIVLTLDNDLTTYQLSGTNTEVNEL